MNNRLLIAGAFAAGLAGGAIGGSLSGDATEAQAPAEAPCVRHVERPLLQADGSFLIEHLEVECSE